MMRLLLISLALLAARPAMADCVGVTSLCACFGAPVIVDGTITAVDGDTTTLHLGTVHRGPHATAADENWIKEELVVPRQDGDSVGALVYVFSPTTRKLRASDGSVTCTSDAPPLKLDTQQFLDLAFADDCPSASLAAGLKEPACNDSGPFVGCATGGTMAAGLLGLLARRRSRRRIG